MKISTAILLAFCALSLPVATVRADVAQKKFEQSLVVPLSRAESAQLTSLMKAATPGESLAVDQALEKFETSKRLRTPAEVREQRPKGATTLYVGKFPIGTGGKPVLVHIWTAARHSLDSNYAFDPAPCYVDAFTKANGKSAKWRRVARSMFMGDGYPDKDGVIPHFLYHPDETGARSLYQIARLYAHRLHCGDVSQRHRDE